MAAEGKVVFRGGFGLNYNQGQIANTNANDGNPPGTSSLLRAVVRIPTQINPNIIYAISSSPTNINGFPSNPHTITTFNSAGLPTAYSANLSALPGPQSCPLQEYQYHYSLDMQVDLGRVSWL